MRVWITRSQPGAERQAAVLNAHGHEALIAPVISIAPLPFKAPIAAFTDVVFLSEHAVRFGVPALEAAKIGLDGAGVFAVGSSTAARLAEAGLAAIAPPIASSEGLLALPQFAAADGRAVLIVAGEGGRDVLARELQARGFRTEVLRVYRRVPMDAVNADLSGVEAIAVGSGDGFEIMARVWFAAHGRSDVPVLVPSQRVAARGQRLGFSRVHVCAGAGAEALVDGLSAFTTHG